MKINKKNISKIIISITLIQIILLVNMTPAEIYQISQVDKVVEKKIAENNLFKGTLKAGINLLIGFFTIKQIRSVSAQELEFNCCLETNQGETCKDFLKGAENNCKSNLIDSSCDKISLCELGCCIDNNEGLCSPKSIKQDCTNSGGNWNNEENCALTECQNSCCVLGNSALFTTEGRCKRLANLYGFEKDFRQQIKNEIDCITLFATQELGACVFSDKECKFISEIECKANKGTFYKNSLCSATSLETKCEKQASTGCVDGKDEIYWFDSCGNRENIYSSDKEMSWNNGKVLTKVESCNPNNPNTNSEDCGNCNYPLGSFCSSSKIGDKKIKNGNFICKDVNCIDENGKQRKNGESWCVYDGDIGEGKDVVGSRHWKRMCINGEVKVEPCPDYRGGICVQAEVENPDKSAKFSVASCVLNEATVCINYNLDSKNMTSKCAKNNMCYLKTINVDEGFKFDICLPQYPKGSDLSYDTGENNLCGMANQKCLVIYAKKVSGWECVFNCNCESSSFSTQMNDFCTSLGDCGTKVNILGEGTNNAEIRNAPGISWENYKQYAQVIEGKFASPRDIEDVLPKHSPTKSEAYIPEQDKISEAVNLGGTITGGLGSLIHAGYFASAFYGTTAGIMSQAGFIASIKTSFGMSTSAMTSTTIGAFGTAFFAIGIGISVGAIVSQVFGLQGQAAMITTIAGGVAGGVAGISAVAGGSAYMAATGGEVIVGTASLQMQSVAMIEGLAEASSIGSGAVAGEALGGGAAGAGTGTSTLGSIATFGGALGPIMAAFVWAIIIAVVVAVVMKILGIGKTKKIIVSFECLPWQAPLGADKCNTCTKDILKPCSKYRCESLGQACKLLNEESENPSCEKIIDNHRPPKISLGKIAPGYNFVNEETWSVKIQRENGGCVPEFTPLKFSINTDEPSQCKFDFQRKEKYEEMGDYALERNNFVSNHSFGIMIPSLNALEVYNVSGDLRQMFGNMNMYIRCQDYYGDVNTREYAVNFCINSGPDLTPAYITKIIPKENSFIKYGATETPLVLYLNEPAECRYDKLNKDAEVLASKEDKEYDKLKNTMNCSTELDQAETFGWPCYTNLTGLTNNENSIYIKCKDQPWFKGTSNESQRNINTISYKYTLYKTLNELKIDSITPSGEIKIGVEPASIDFEVKTSGGAYNGNSACYYDFEEYKNMVLFSETFSNIHKQNINLLMNGQYTMYVKCIDEAGNSAESKTEFNIKLDKNPPEITRAYKEGGQLIVLTDENADCYYTPDRCNFDEKNATAMTTGYSQKHVTDWKPGTTYHIKCFDVWGNRPDSCSIRLLPSFFISLFLNKFINKDII